MSNRHTGKLITPVILAGGVGSRLYPVSTPECPKQFIPTKNGDSLFQQTIARVQDPSIFYAPLVVAHERHRNVVKDQARPHNYTEFYEPNSRNTASAVVISALRLLKQGRETALVLPSDHVIHNTAPFHEAVKMGTDHMGLHNDHVLFGITPTEPSPDFGYIQSNHFGHITHFHEKPSIDVAAALLKSSPDTFWNSGIFVLNLPLLMAELKTIAPEFLVRCEIAYANPTLKNYSAIPSVAFDKLYLEYSHSLFCIKADFDWMDIGMQPALLERRVS